MTPSPSKRQDLSQSGSAARSSDSRTFEFWWYNIGSGYAPLRGEDMETFAKRVCEIAWYASKVDSMKGPTA